MAWISRVYGEMQSKSLYRDRLLCDFHSGINYWDSANNPRILPVFPLILPALISNSAFSKVTIKWIKCVGFYKGNLQELTIFFAFQKIVKFF